MKSDPSNPNHVEALFAIMPQLSSHHLEISEEGLIVDEGHNAKMEAAAKKAATTAKNTQRLQDHKGFPYIDKEDIYIYYTIHNTLLDHFPFLRHDLESFEDDVLDVDDQREALTFDGVLQFYQNAMDLLVSPHNRVKFIDIVSENDNRLGEELLRIHNRNDGRQNGQVHERPNGQMQQAVDRIERADAQLRQANERIQQAADRLAQANERANERIRQVHERAAAQLQLRPVDLVDLVNDARERVVAPTRIQVPIVIHQPRNVRKCSVCRQPNHNKRNCPQNRN